MTNQSERYARLNQLGALKETKSSNFSKFPLAIVGLGNLGGQVIQHLGMMGFPLLLVDNGIVKETNLGTQGFWGNDVGKPKVKARKEYLQTLNPDCAISVFYESIAILGAGNLYDAKILFGCLDSWHARGQLHEIAWELGIPLIDGGLDGSGERFLGRVSVIDPRKRENPCLFCSWDKEMFQKIKTESDGGNSCPQISLGSKNIKTHPTMMPSSIGGVIAGIQVTQALKLLFTQTVKEKTSFEIIADVSANRFFTVDLQANPNCVFPHQNIKVERLHKKTHQITVKGLFETMQKQFETDIQISLHRKQIAPQLICEKGHIQKDVYRIIETLPEKNIEMLCACGSPLFSIPQQLLRSFNYEKAKPFAVKTWSELGVSEGDILTVNDDKHIIRVLFS